MRILLTIFTWTLAALPQICEAAPSHRDIVFANVGDHQLRLDLYLPKNIERPPLVVFIHGGGWRNNSYKKCLTPWLTNFGFAVASIGYRLSDQAQFPAQIHDCKAAVRWLRAHAKQYGYNADCIGVAGTSAGGHLAMMLGMTGGDESLEGTVGGNERQSSRVQAIVDYYGPTDFVLRSKTQPSKTEYRDSPVRLLLGVAASENTKLARLASPAFHISRDDPPLLILHGEKDTTVFLEQSERIVQEYRQNQLDVTLEIVRGAGHGGSAHFTESYRKKVAHFFRSRLQPATNANH